MTTTTDEMRKYYSVRSPWRLKHCVFMGHPIAPQEAAEQRPSADPWFYYKLLYVRLFEFLSDSGVQHAGVRTVLDVGSGGGGGLGCLAGLLPAGARLVGSDILPEHVAAARAHVADLLNVECNTFDVTRADPDGPVTRAGPYDLVVAVGVLFSHMREHPEWLDAAFATIAGLLRPGGILVLWDSFVPSAIAEERAQMEASGLRVLNQQDMTAEVMLGLDLHTAHLFGPASGETGGGGGLLEGPEDELAVYRESRTRNFARKRQEVLSGEKIYQFVALQREPG